MFLQDSLTPFHSRRHDIPNIIPRVRAKDLTQTLRPHQPMERQTVIIWIRRLLSMAHKEHGRSSRRRDSQQQSKTQQRAQEHCRPGDTIGEGEEVGVNSDGTFYLFLIFFSSPRTPLPIGFLGPNHNRTTRLDSASPVGPKLWIGPHPAPAGCGTWIGRLLALWVHC